MENKKLHILVVDDDDRIRDLLKDYLSKNNYIISTAENAQEAKRKLELIKFDILLTNSLSIDSSKEAMTLLKFLGSGYFSPHFL